MKERQIVAIVDDDKSIRNATQDLLNAAGYSTAAFADAESFLESANRANTACVIADMRMPGMTGVELYLELIAAGQGIPTIIISAHPEELARARDAGIACSLLKPFEPDELLGCVKAAVSRSSGRDA